MSIFIRRSSSWWLRTLALAGAAASPDLALALAGWGAVEPPTRDEPRLAPWPGSGGGSDPADAIEVRMKG